MKFDKDTMLARYRELEDARDVVNAVNAPLEKELTLVNEQVAGLQARANDLAAQIDARRGGQMWIDLKKELGMIANFLKRIPPREKVAEKTAG